MNDLHCLEIDIQDLSGDNSVANVQSFLLPDGYEAKIVQSKLSQANIYIGTGSACSNQSNKGNIPHYISISFFSLL